jgi:mannose/fructose-specific phosphotransferase system component IIA
VIYHFLTRITTPIILGTVAFISNIAEASPLIQKDLFFGRNISSGGQVSEEQFQTFVDQIITPLFPNGLTIFDAEGQFRDSSGMIIEEPSKLVTLFVDDTPASQSGINQVVSAYLDQFNQESVLQVTNKDELKIGFGAGENLIENDLIPELIQADLFFGRNIAGGGEVSEEQFQTFVAQIITPLFPAGLTIFDAEGQFKDSSEMIIEEPSKVVTLLFEDTTDSENSIDQIISAYIQQFNQESVLVAVNEEVAVGFGAGENLIENDLIPELIQADLFFGKNIAGGGEVSEEQFQTFVAQIITPLFPAGLTIFDAEGQFKDSSEMIIEEPSKVITLLFEDTAINEQAIDEIITAYLQQFAQESVLLVVDEDVTVAFDAQSIPEPGIVLGLLLSSVFSLTVCKSKPTN